MISKIKILEKLAKENDVPFDIVHQIFIEERARIPTDYKDYRQVAIKKLIEKHVMRI